MKLIKLTPNTDDRNSCTVNALSTATNMPWYEAQALLTKYGRQRNKGMAWYPLLKAYNETLKTEYVMFWSWEKPTLAQFARNNPKGKFIVRVSGHVLVVEDGVQHDTFLNGARRRVLGYWPVK